MIKTCQTITRSFSIIFLSACQRADQSREISHVKLFSNYLFRQVSFDLSLIAVVRAWESESVDLD